MIVPTIPVEQARPRLYLEAPGQSFRTTNHFFLFVQWRLSATWLCQALSENYQGSIATAENLLVVNMRLMWAANYIIWVARCYSWCTSKWGLQSGDFNMSNNQSKMYISLPSNLFHRMFTVQVDEDKGQTQRLPTDQPISVKKLFVGGTSSQFQTAPLRNIPPFEGCIWNLVINAT